MLAMLAALSPLRTLWTVVFAGIGHSGVGDIVGSASFVFVGRGAFLGGVVGGAKTVAIRATLGVGEGTDMDFVPPVSAIAIVMLPSASNNEIPAIKNP